MTDYIWNKEEDGENWTATSAEEAIECLIENDPEVQRGDEITIYRGEKRPIDISRFIPDISEIIEERMFDELGDWFDEWLGRDDSKSLNSAVDAAVLEWVEDNNQRPEMWEVINIEPIKFRIINCSDTPYEYVRLWLNHAERL